MLLLLLLLLLLLYRAQLTPEAVGAVQQPRRLPPRAAGPAPQNYNHKPPLKKFIQEARHRLEESYSSRPAGSIRHSFSLASQPI